MTLNVPMTAVRSFGRITAATKAERGAESIDCVQARRIKKTRARGMFDGRGIMCEYHCLCQRLTGVLFSWRVGGGWRDDWRNTNIDIAKASGKGSCNKSRKCCDDACGEEDGTERAIGEVELFFKEYSEPRAKVMLTAD